MQRGKREERKPGDDREKKETVMNVGKREGGYSWFKKVYTCDSVLKTN